VRYLALDVGDRRIGLAVGEDTFRIARPLPTLRRRSLAADLEAVADVVRREEAAALVIGLPRTLAGAEGHQALRVRRFAAAASSLGLPISLHDERNTTVEAARLGATDLDAGAATVLLEDFLASRPA
jgi:putative holliday junction resolvase